MSFRLGAEDAPYFVREFVDRLEQIDFIQLPNHSFYLKLMIDGMRSKSAVTLPRGASGNAFTIASAEQRAECREAGSRQRALR
jgi:hypothetical protein